MKKVLTTCFLLLTVGGIPVFAQRINDLTGINAQAIDPLNMQKRFSWVRIWHDWSNDMAYDNNCTAECTNVNTPADWQLQWNPSLNNQTGPYLSYNTYYASLAKTGIPVLKGIAPKMRGNTNYPNCYATGQKPLEQKPICLTTNAWCNPDPTGCGLPNLADLPTPTTGQETPVNWAQHSLWVSLFAAKFGLTTATHPQSYLDDYLSSGETAPLFGSNLIQYLEDNNEPNKSWYDQGATAQDFLDGNTRWYFSPDQLGAMLRADYNGNGNAMMANGKNLGIANFSTGVTPVMGGLSGLHGKYINDMNAGPNPLNSNWILNFHHYCTDQSKVQNTKALFDAGEFINYSTILLNGNGGKGVSPELDSLGGKLKWLKSGINDRNYWFTEFGYDSFPTNGANNSGVEAQPITGGDGTYDSQKVQAQWLTRGVLAAAYSKAVDRMMLYELADHPTVNNENYSYSGLLTKDGKTKRSWYYIMTMKFLIGEYIYSKAIKNGVGGFTVQFKSGNNWVAAGWDKVRVYEFINGTEKVYAIWSPTEAAVTPFAVRITFPSGTITTPASATLHKITELSETGQRLNWSSNVSGQTVTIDDVNTKVSETPLFLHINKLYANYYTPPAHATNLSCAAQSCCGSVDLTWTPPAGGTRNTLVFYKERPMNTNCPTTFDFVSWTLFSNNIGFNRDRITVTGLEQGKQYCFAVIPISLYGVGIPPDNISAAQILSCGNTVGSCSSCLINITSGELAVGAGSDLTTTKLATLLSADGIANGCTDINPADCTNPNTVHTSWTEWKDPVVFPEANTFYINFTSPKRINAIFAQDWNGNGDIKIEYEGCNCPNIWNTLTTLKLEGTGLCNGSGYFIKEVSTNALVTRLRVTKLHPSAVLRRLFFCGANEACPPPGGSTRGVASDFRADEIRENSALLRWSAAQMNTMDAQSDFIDKYEVKVSQQIDQAGALANAMTLNAETGIYEMEGTYRLSGLAPATTYYAEVAAVTDPCPASPVQAPVEPNKLRISFTTESKVDGRDSKLKNGLKTQTKAPYSVYLQPNPASNDVQVTITAGELESVILMDMNGRVMKQTPSRGSSMSLNLEGVQPGVYWVRTVRTDKTVLTVLLVKS
jgi:Secretion system C-terminal sorting domain